MDCTAALKWQLYAQRRTCMSGRFMLPSTKAAGGGDGGGGGDSDVGAGTTLPVCSGAVISCSSSAFVLSRRCTCDWHARPPTLDASNHGRGARRKTRKAC